MSFQILDCKSGCFQELTIVSKLDKGAFGDVYKVEDARKHVFALRKMTPEHYLNTKNNSASNDKLYQDVVGNLLYTMSCLKHPHIVQLYAFDFESTSTLLVMEFCPGGNLNNRLRDPVNMKQKFDWMSQLLEAMTYLHNNNFVHRNFKPENVLLGNRGQAKMADFGLARPFLTRDLKNNEDYLSEYEDMFMDKYAGTMYWIAPEVFDRKYTEKADIFSLGVIFYAILTRKYLTYQGESYYYGAFVEHHGKEVGLGLAMHRSEKNIEPSFEGLKETIEQDIANNVIKSLLCYDYNKRMSLDQAHSFIFDALAKIEKQCEKSVLEATTNPPARRKPSVAGYFFKRFVPGFAACFDEGKHVVGNIENTEQKDGEGNVPREPSDRPGSENANQNICSVSSQIDSKNDVLKNFEQHYSCPICLDIVCEAVECKVCHKLYCDECVRELNTCPSCRQPFNTQPNKNVRQFIGNLKTKCPNEECREKPTRSNLQEHLKKCEWALTLCENEGCELEFRRIDLPKHLFDCSYQIVFCRSVGCKESFPRKRFFLHKNECLFSPVRCLDCLQLYLKKDETVHFKMCKRKKIECPICQLEGTRLDILHHGVDIHYDNVVTPFYQSMVVSASSSSHQPISQEEDRLFAELDCI
ncbi:uncharacterized protein [Clytia hemisphaerica]|uniref:uncharacterized protein isoform X1 n=1 Tax=Clytia hemisphaerica TaxID=252671 RepID=UPI0034D61039